MISSLDNQQEREKCSKFYNIYGTINLIIRRIAMDIEKNGPAFYSGHVFQWIKFSDLNNYDLEFPSSCDLVMFFVTTVNNFSVMLEGVFLC